MAENAIIGFDRWTSLLENFAGGSWESAYPLTNLSGLPLSRVARSTDATMASTQFDVELPSPSKPVRLVTLVRHNISLVGKMRLRVWQDTAQTNLRYDSDWIDVWPQVYPPDQVDWEDDFFWSLKYTEREIEGLNATRPIWLDDYHLVRSLRLEIDDTGNPDGYIQLGMLDLCKGWQVGFNYQYGARLGWRFRSSATEADGGAKYFDRRPKPRIFRGNLLISHDEALARGLEHQRQMDADVPFVWFPRPDSEVHWLRETFLARNAEPDLIEFANPAQAGVPLSLEEVLG